MSTKNQDSPQEEKAIIKGAGCLNLVLAALIPICALPVFADKTHFFITYMMAFFTFFGLSLAMYGLIILALPVIIIKTIFGRSTEEYDDARKFEKSRIWSFFQLLLVFFI